MSNLGIQRPGVPGSRSNAPSHPFDLAYHLVGHTDRAILTDLSAFVAEFAPPTGSKSFALVLHSVGGDVDAALAMYQLLQAAPFEITTINVGTCQSAAVLLFAVGKTRLVLEASTFLLHRATRSFGGGGLTASGLASEQAQLAHAEDVQGRLIGDVVQGGVEQVRQLMETDSYLSADDALALGLATGKATGFWSASKSRVFRSDRV